MQASQIAAFAALSEAEVTAIAYEEAANGNSAKALRWAVDDLLAMEARLAEAIRAVSHGHIRGDLPPTAA